MDLLHQTRALIWSAGSSPKPTRSSGHFQPGTWSEQEWARGKEAEAMKWPKGLRKRKRPRGPKSSSPCLCLLECKLQHPRAALLRGTEMSIDTNGSEGLLGQLPGALLSTGSCMRHINSSAFSYNITTFTHPPRLHGCGQHQLHTKHVQTPHRPRDGALGGFVLWETADRFPWGIRLLLHLGAVVMNALGNPEQPSCASRSSFRTCVYLRAPGQELQPPTPPTAQPTLSTLKH